MWFPLFVLGSFWFWVLVIAEFFCLFAAVRRERVCLAWVSLLFFSLAMWLFGNFNVFFYILNNPIFISCCFLVYLATGILWSFGKWVLFNWTVKKTYNGMKEVFLKNKKRTGTRIPEDLMEEWVEYLSNRQNWRDHNNDWNTYVPNSYRVFVAEDIKPQARDYKSNILFWISFWPISMLWSLLHDFIEYLANEAYNCFRSIYGGITRRVFRGIDDDFKNPEKSLDSEGR